MEAIKRQATKLRDHVAKQQQALLRQLGHFDAEAIIKDEGEIARYHELQKLYDSTRSAKHFEKDIVHGLEGLVSVSSKQIEIERRFARDCCRYDAEAHCDTAPLKEVALHLSGSHNLMVKEMKTLIRVFDEQICKPLRALVKSAELEDARLLIRQYDRLWLEVETQAAEVLRFRSKSKESTKSGENSIKLQVAEEKFEELKSRLMALGKEAISAMQSVEAQQQQMTFQQLVVMVNAERSFHRNTLTILEKLHDEMIQVEQSSETSPPAKVTQDHTHVPKTEHLIDNNGDKGHGVHNEDNSWFIAKVVHPFDAQAEGELSLSLDDTVVVLQVTPGGWSKGECNDKTGWFPSPYVDRLGETAKAK